MSLATPDRIQELRTKLHRKAKEEPEFRFYSLYDKVYRADILQHAYHLSRSNQGAAGVDGVTFEDIDSRGEDQFLEALAKDLRDETYRAEAVRRVMIPKANGGERPLGIPTIKDRTVQTAVKLLMEPIFEADLPANAHGYREGHSAQQAVKEVHELLKQGYTDVVDADLSKYFDTVPHDELLRSVARRISDGKILRLVKMWLKAPIEETDDRNHRHRRSPGNLGTPQGGVISPLLANIYMRRFLITFDQRHRKPLRAHVVNYADDEVICCRGTAPAALSAARVILTRIGLTLNEAKTRVCNAWDESFNFLGYTFGKCYDPRSGRAYLGAKPAEKSLKRIREKIHDLTTAATTCQSETDLIKALNRAVRGWCNYFRYGTLVNSYWKVEAYVEDRLRQWLVRKHKGQRRGTRQYPSEQLSAMGLVRPSALLAAFRTPSV